MVARGCFQAPKCTLRKEQVKPVAAPSNMSGRRQSFATGALPAAKAARAAQGPDTLVACVRPWGRASWVFEGRGTYTYLLKQVFHVHLAETVRHASCETVLHGTLE